MRDALFLQVIKYLFKVFPFRGGLFYFTSTFYCKQQYSWLAAVPAVGLGTVNQLFIAIPICSNFVLVEKYSCI